MKYDYKQVQDYLIKCRFSLYEYFKKYDFQWFCSLKLPMKNIVITCNLSEVLLKEWRKVVCIKEKIQICYQGIIVHSNIVGSHIHLLMSGKNKNGETLFDKDKKLWVHTWDKMVRCGKSHIEDVEDDGVLDYIVSLKNTPVNHFELVQPYNKSLLSKYIR